jgi:hypothetical protein
MQLKKDGFSGGDSLIRKLINNGKIKIDININDFRPDINVYAEILDLDESEFPYRDVAHMIVSRSIETRVGYSSFLSSKSLGALVLIMKRRAYAKDPNFTVKSYKAIDDRVAASCGMGKTTFQKFIISVYKNIDEFMDIFESFNL